VRLVTVDTADGPAGGVITASGSIAALERWDHLSVEELLSAGPSGWDEVEREAANSPSDWGPESRLLSPITRPPRNMFCIGVNYVDHYDEGQRQNTSLPDIPIIFTKAWTTLIGATDDIVVDRRATTMVDWEAELAVIIGLGGVNISEADALRHVFGYCLANDVSARDLQRAGGTFAQWHKGKSLDTFCPLGPSIVTAASAPDFETLQVQLTVNGVPKQSFRPDTMVHPIPKIIAYLSLGMALLPGDIILTGTASGVGLWQDPQQFLVAGDVVEVTCDGLGTLRNKVVDRVAD